MKPAVDPDEIPAPKPVTAAQTLPLLALAGKPEMAAVPDFRGKSMRDVVEESSAEGLDVTIEGSGVARAQLPLPGSPLRRGEKIRIVFTR
jgi:hypothetical protein